jgi:hypothetical protein
MRFLICGLLAMALSACGQQSPQQRAESGCARSATHEVDFTAAETPETVTARSEGPSCAQSFVVLTVRNSEGDPLWITSNTYYDLAEGGIPLEPSPVSDERMDAFLQGLADVSMLKSGELPAWREDAASLAESVTEDFAYFTELPRDSYEMLRGRDLPMLCYAAAAEASHCIVMDPLSNAPIMIAGFGA